jgi:glycosyltransferase involved in cell wall biosynthesis
MACGAPVLASRVGGVGELVVEDDTGWLVPPGDDDALRAGLSFVLAHPQAVASMRPRARRLAEERVSPTVVATELQRCFAEVMGGRRG